MAAPRAPAKPWRCSRTEPRRSSAPWGSGREVDTLRRVRPVPGDLCRVARARRFRPPQDLPQRVVAGTGAFGRIPRARLPEGGGRTAGVADGPPRADRAVAGGRPPASRRRAPALDPLRSGGIVRPRRWTARPGDRG